jgi:hypothetical protein
MTQAETRTNFLIVVDWGSEEATRRGAVPGPRRPATSGGGRARLECPYPERLC